MQRNKCSRPIDARQNEQPNPSSGPFNLGLLTLANKVAGSGIWTIRLLIYGFQTGDVILYVNGKPVTNMG